MSEQQSNRSSIENTAKRDPLLHLAGALGDSDRYITDMESAGQRQLVHSDRLPTELHGGTTEDLEALGFKVGDPDPSDPMFRPVTLPEGWTREGSDHAMWSYIHDTNGRERLSIFYKAAFYDRKAHASIVTIHGAANSILWGDDKTLVIDEWTTREAWVSAFTAIRDKELKDAEERDSYYPKGAAASRERAAQCDEFLKQLSVAQ